MEGLYLHSALKKYAKLNARRFHMPGHKGDSEFKKFFRQAREDVTEIEGFDNLDNPSGIIAAAENDIADILKAKKCWMTTDGATSGIFSMVYAVKGRGSKLIVNRNAHKSVFNICRVLGIEPVVLHQNVQRGILLPPSTEEIKRAVSENPEAIGALLTYPDYYGLTFDIEETKKILFGEGKLLLVDNSHGSHMRFTDTEKYAGDYADAWVDSVHKTLPVLTQGAVICAGNSQLIPFLDEAVRVFRSTSPSYLIMSSIEYGEKFMSKFGAERLKALNEEILLLKNRLSARGYGVLYGNDVCKLVIDFKKVNVSTYIAEKFLAEKKIYPELNDGRYIVFMLSANTYRQDLNALENALVAILKKKKFASTFKDRADVMFGMRKKSYLDAMDGKKTAYLPLEECVGKVSASNFGLTPPCFPLVIAGEIITEEIVNLVKSAKGTFGITDGKVKVIKG